MCVDATENAIKNKRFLGKEIFLNEMVALTQAVDLTLLAQNQGVEMKYESMWKRNMKELLQRQIRFGFIVQIKLRKAASCLKVNYSLYFQPPLRVHFRVLIGQKCWLNIALQVTSHRKFCNIARLSHSRTHTLPHWARSPYDWPNFICAHLGIDCPELRVLPQYCAPQYLFTLSQHSSIFQYLNIALHLVIRTAFLAGKCQHSDILNK